MNFDCVGRDSKGQLYMRHHMPFTIVEKIQNLERWILVKLFAYYELNDNTAPDLQYDINVRQLETLYRTYSKEFKRSRYYTYFHDFYDYEECAANSYTLIERIKNTNYDLYTRIERDAYRSLEFSRKGI